MRHCTPYSCELRNSLHFPKPLPRAPRWPQGFLSTPPTVLEQLLGCLAAGSESAAAAAAASSRHSHPHPHPHPGAANGHAGSNGTASTGAGASAAADAGGLSGWAASSGPWAVYMRASDLAAVRAALGLRDGAEAGADGGGEEAGKEEEEERRARREVLSRLLVGSGYSGGGGCASGDGGGAAAAAAGEGPALLRLLKPDEEASGSGPELVRVRVCARCALRLATALVHSLLCQKRLE